MEEESLATAFSDSLTEEVSGCVGEFLEIGIDSLLEDGLTKDIPFLSTFTSIYKIGKTIQERYHLKKLAVFLNEINSNTTNEETRRYYRRKFCSNEKYRNKELEYITILIDRYTELKKPQLLAKVYLAYLCADIDWHSFVKFAEIIDRLLPNDYLLLNEEALNIAIHNDNYDIASRLVSVGLAYMKVDINPFINAEGSLELVADQRYTITGLGIQFKRILDGICIPE